MAIEIIMPKTGMDMKEGKIIRWLKETGDRVEEGESLLEIETDKVTMDIEATTDGILLSKYYENGQIVPAVTVIGYIGLSGEALPEKESISIIGIRDTSSLETKTEYENKKEPACLLQNHKILATPAAKRLAKQRNMPLNLFAPSGTHREIRARDVLERKKITPLAKRMLETVPFLAKDISGTGFAGKITKKDIITVMQHEKPNSIIQDQKIPISGMRKVIAERMVRSVQGVPTVTYHMKADVTKLIEMKEDLNSQTEFHFTINDFVLKAVALSLVTQKGILAYLDQDEIVYPVSINLGMAVELDEGLIVPVIKNADQLSLIEMAKQARDCSARAKAHTLQIEEYQGSTFTVSNLGMFGVEYFTPILNEPESGILGVCSVEEEVKRINGEFVVRKIMGLSSTHDHRVIDGAPAAKFLSEVKRLLEHPALLLLS